MDKKEQQKIINSIIFNSVLILILLLFFWLYLLPQYWDFSDQKTSANELYTAYNKLKIDWININDIQSTFARNGSSKAIMATIKDKDKLKNILKKDSASMEYLVWINKELSKESAFTKEIKNNETILWNILPVFYQYWDSYNNESSQIEYQVTLENFTSFIETDILKKHNIISFSSIGIDNITFDNTKTVNKVKSDISNWTEIWSFILTLDFQAKNKDISSLLEYIQDSWKLDIQNGKLINKVKQSTSSSKYSDLDNLLMSIDNINLSKPLSNPDNDNKWVIRIKFYVRWMWYDQLNTIKTKSINKIAKLTIDMVQKSKLCDKWISPLCKELVWSEAVANVRSLLKDIAWIQTRIDTKTKTALNVNMNINSELSDWLSILTWLETIESSYSKSATYINNFLLKWAK